MLGNELSDQLSELGHQATLDNLALHFCQMCLRESFCCFASKKFLLLMDKPSSTSMVVFNCMLSCWFQCAQRFQNQLLVMHLIKVKSF